MPLKVDPGQDWRKTRADLQRAKAGDIFASLEKFGQMGVAALAAATPVESGETAAAWSYEIEQRQGHYSIHWKNSHTAGRAPLAILLQIGHGTGTGGYVQGRDYINPAMRPIFDQIEAEARKAVTR